MNDKQTLPHPLLNTRRFFLVENVAQLSEEKKPLYHCSNSFWIKKKVYFEHIKYKLKVYTLSLKGLSLNQIY